MVCTLQSERSLVSAERECGSVGQIDMQQSIGLKQERHSLRELQSSSDGFGPTDKRACKLKITRFGSRGHRYT